MNKVQRFWLVGVMVFYSLHLVRDLQQDFGIWTAISTMFVKHDRTNVPWWYWYLFNTYVIELSSMLLAFLAFKEQKFGWKGRWTVYISLFFFSVWSLYYFGM